MRHILVVLFLCDSTRVSNELGAGNHEAVRVAVSVSMFLAVTEALIISATLFGCRHMLGYAYSNDSVVVDYVAGITPLLCISVFMDALQAVLTGYSYSPFHYFACCLKK